MKRFANRLMMAGSALALLASLANAGQDLITVKDLNPFTHVVRLPGGADLSSIRFEQAKLVKVPTRVTSVENAPAYEITYSYDGPAIASDEFSAATRKMLEKKAARSDLAAVFHLTSSREPARRVAIDEADSRFCEGNYVDGAWQRRDTQCNEIVKYQTVTSPSEYATIRIGVTGTERADTATAAAGNRR